MIEECPKCGCNDIQKAGQAARWGKTWQRWTCGNCGYLWSEAPDKSANPVVFVKTMCPHCDSGDVVVTRTIAPKRYHHCRGCGGNFASIEGQKDNRTDFPSFFTRI